MTTFAKIQIATYVAAIVGLVIYFYAFHEVFHPTYGATALTWLPKTWNSANELQHGYLVPFVIVYLLWREKAAFRAFSEKRCLGALFVLAVGLLTYWLSIRTSQQRIMVGSLPVLLSGIVWYFWGWDAFKKVLVPFGLVYFIMPFPGLTQATSGLQVIATKGSYLLVSLLGIETSVSGNTLHGSAGGWGFDVAEGCSGIRSLLAMTLIAVLYSHLAERTLWKKAVLVLLSVPLAALANTLRVASIVIIAHFFDAEFAGNLYHDYSAFLFFPFALITLLVLHKFLNFRVNFSKKKTWVKAVNK